MLRYVMLGYVMLIMYQTFNCFLYNLIPYYFGASIWQRYLADGPKIDRRTV